MRRAPRDLLGRFLDCGLSRLFDEMGRIRLAPAIAIAAYWPAIFEGTLDDQRFVA